MRRSLCCHDRLTTIRRLWIAGVAALLGLLAPKFAAAQQFVDVRRCERFVICSETPLSGREGWLEDLRRLPGAIGERLRLRPDDEEIHVYLFASEDSFRRYLAAAYPRITPRPALFVKGRGPGLVMTFHKPELATDLRHECTHALLQNMMPGLPLWLDEGLAEYFESPLNRQEQGHAYLEAVRRRAARGLAPRLQSLELQTDPARFAEEDYRDAWSWVHFGLHGPPEVQATFLEHLQGWAGGDEPASLHRQWSQKAGLIESRWATHFSRLR